MNPGECLLCAVLSEGREVLVRTRHAVAIPDAFPVSLGHSLVVARRHEADFFALSFEERADIFEAVVSTHALLRERFIFDGINVGLNNGDSAGQTIPHVHIHLIPRRKGDVPDPRGGVRWVLPERARYWTGAE